MSLNKAVQPTDKFIMQMRAHTQFIAHGLVSLLLISMLSSCGAGGISSASSRNQAASTAYSNPPTYSELNTFVFQPKCVSCHAQGSSNFTSYSSLMATGTIVAGSASSSRVYQQTSLGYMPKVGGPLSAGDVKAIYDWIQAGALNSN